MIILFSFVDFTGLNCSFIVSNNKRIVGLYFLESWERIEAFFFNSVMFNIDLLQVYYDFIAGVEFA